jgi:hypothetical protein
MRLIVDAVTRDVVGITTDAAAHFEGTHFLVEPPADFLGTDPRDWHWDGEQLVHTEGYGLLQARAQAALRIKQEAANRLAALDWKLERAREREQAGIGSLTDVAAILTMREEIRQSSNSAEARLLTLNEYSEIDFFTWRVDVTLPVPRLISQQAFSARLTDVELAGIIEAATHYAPIGAWLERFRATKTLDLDSPILSAGVTALEIAGLLSAGRAQQILQ